MARYAEGNQLLHSFHYHFRVRRNSDHCCKQVWNDSTILEDWRPWLIKVWSKHSTDILYPIQSLAFGVFMRWQILNKVLGRTWFDFYPKQWMSGLFGSIFNTSTNHIVHHENRKGNYGIYFNIWDRHMATNLPDHEKSFVQVTSNPKSKSEANSAALPDKKQWLTFQILELPDNLEWPIAL